MLVAQFLKNIVINFVNHYKRIFAISKQLSKHNTCQFDMTSQIIDCDFGKNVKIFENTKMVNAQVGAYSYIQTQGRIFNCQIGKFCSIAASVSIAPGIHDMNFVTTHPSLVQKTTPLPKVFAKKDNLLTSKKVIIGHDVWIGEKVVILDGVNIGNGAVIASGAIVNKDVAPYSVVGGVPAKHIKYRFDPEIIAILQESKWWDYSDEWFENNHELMLDTQKFIQYLKNDK